MIFELDRNTLEVLEYYTIIGILKNRAITPAVLRINYREVRTELGRLVRRLLHARVNRGMGECITVEMVRFGQILGKV